MGASHFIARKPLLIIAIWFIIAAASAPLFMKLDNVLVTQEQGLLPPNTESQQAEKLLKNITGSTGESSAIILVDNVNVSSPDTALKMGLWYMNEKQELSKYAEKTMGYPVIIAEVYNSIRNQSHKGLNQSVFTVTKSIEAAEIVNKTIQNAWHLDYALFDGTKDTQKQLLQADRAYVNVYGNLTLLRQSYLNLNNTVYALSYAWNTIPDLYSKTWFDISRTNYFLMTNTTAYQTGNLTPSDIALVAKLTNTTGIGSVNPEAVALYYKLIMNMTQGNPLNADYKIISQATMLVCLQKMQQQGNARNIQMIEGALKAYDTVWEKSLEIANLTNLPYLYQFISQQNIYNVIKDVESKSTPYAIKAFSAVMAEGMAVKTRINSTLLVKFIENASNLKYPPDPSDADKLISGLLISNAGTEEEKSFLAQALTLVSKRDPAPQDALKMIMYTIEKETENPGIAANMGSILAHYDPQANGAILTNNETLANGVADLFTVMAPANLTSILNTTMIHEIVYSFARIIGGKNITENEALSAINQTYNIIIKEFSKEVLNKTPENSRPFMLYLFNAAGNSGIYSYNIRQILMSFLVKQVGNLPAEEVNGNVPVELIKANLWEAFNVAYYHNETFDVAVEKLSKQTFYNTYGELLDSLKGNAISNDAMAFIVTLKPYAKPSEEDPTYYYQAENFTQIVNNSLKNYVKNYKVYLTGSGIIEYETHQLTGKDMKRVDILSNTMVVIFLFLVLESIAAVIIPFIGILVAILIAGALAYLIVTGGIIDLSSWARVVMITTSLGLGADYAGFISYRFREEFHNIKDSKLAAEKALSRTYTAILTSATTAIIGFGSLSLAHDFPFLLSFGVAIPLAIFVTMLAGVTLIPALLSLLGGHSKFWWPKTPEKLSVRARSWLGGKVVKYAKIVIIVWILVSIPSAYAYATFKGSNNMQIFLPENSEAVKNFNIVSEKFGAGIIYQTYIVVELNEPWNTTNSINSLKIMDHILKSKDYVAGVSGPLEYVNSTKILGSCEANPYVNKDGTLLYISVFQKDNPLSNKGINEVKELRETLHAINLGTSVKKVLVGGTAASMLEMESLLNERFYHRVLPVAVILMIIAFAIAFNSIVAALAAITVIVTSAMIAIASTEIIFQDWIGKPVLWFLPIMVLTAILGVGMDYNSFYLSRAKEECLKKCSDNSIILATARVGLLVFGLSLILGSAYLSMISSHTWGMRELGFTLGIGILLAGAMASYLVNPSIIAILKDRMWRKIR
ncbi:MAG: MMPL family transporter [Desulfurococcales archaeon]|nr:MMPL family transporter [Desulfurococcales archaeon]